MDYSLLEKLKNKGFKKEHIFDEKTSSYCLNCPYYEDYQPYVGEQRNSIEGMCTPTLEELIEVCGDGYFHLHREGDIWRAKTYPLDWATGSSTASEAVANLWLALQDK